VDIALMKQGHPHSAIHSPGLEKKYKNPSTRMECPSLSFPEGNSLCVRFDEFKLSLKYDKMHSIRGRPMVRYKMAQ
jgi:hypothetical protein